MIKRMVQKLKRTFGPRKPAPSGSHGDPLRYGDLITDEYVTHLRSVIGGWALEGNIRAFECCVRNMPPGGAIVEIGSFLGLSTNIIAYAAHKYKRDNSFFSCDPWKFAGSERPKSGYFSTGTKEYRDWVLTIYKMNLSLFSPSFDNHTIEAFSVNFFDLWEKSALVNDVFSRSCQLGGPIAFAYVDGDHSYEGGKRDFLDVDRSLMAGGYILLDDSADDSSYVGLNKLVCEIAARPDYELILKAPNYCFKKRSTV